MLRGEHRHRLTPRGAELRWADEAPLPLDEDPQWLLVFDGVSDDHERALEALLTLADGRLGTSGHPLGRHPAAHPEVRASGVYEGDGSESHLVSCPIWSLIDYELQSGDRLRRILNMRTGVLHEDLVSGEARYRSVRFSSLARPGLAALLAVTSGFLHAGSPLVLPDGVPENKPARKRTVRSAVVAGMGMGVAVRSTQSTRGEKERRIHRRMAAYDVSPGRPRQDRADRALREAAKVGFDGLLAEQRAAWGRRWAEADVLIEGDSRLQGAVRLALFHLMSSVADRGEAAVGARGLSGQGYRGHVFWDSDVFVLPFLAATHPAAARAMLRYRLRRVPAAREAARNLRRAGARFAWESAASGEDVTPHSTRDWSGQVIPIRTGRLEDHVVADVAWAAVQYAAWTGDAVFLSGAGQPLLVETARYWASRVRFDHEGRAHIYGVVGPDEYHEPVDDNAFTNVMARWNLRRAADEARYEEVRPLERLRWREIADAIVDGYDPRTRLYEQFSGFYDLEPLIVTEVAPKRPVSGEALLGRDRLRGAQVLKQADVLMLHHLVPEETAPGSLVPNLDFYEPRTAHGSSLSPGIHAAVLARACRLEEAAEALDITARMDLDDLSGTTAGGLHLATMGSLWQALVSGFAGIRPMGDTLLVDPHLPERWKALEIRLRFRGSPLVVRMERRHTWVRAGRPVTVRLGESGVPVRVGRSAVQLTQAIRTDR